MQYKNYQFVKVAQEICISAQFLEKFAQKQNVPKFWKILPNFQVAQYMQSSQWPYRKDLYPQIFFKKKVMATSLSNGSNHPTLTILIPKTQSI